MDSKFWLNFKNVLTDNQEPVRSECSSRRVGGVTVNDDYIETLSANGIQQKLQKVLDESAQSM